MRPVSIVNFERLYLLAILLGVVNTYLDWTDIVGMVGMESGGQLGQRFAAAVTIIGLAIQLVLLFFIAHRSSALAKWIFVVLIGIELLYYIWGLVNGALIYALRSGVTSPLGFLVGLIGILLKVGAVWMLFRPDSKIWFGEDVPETEAP